MPTTLLLASLLLAVACRKQPAGAAEDPRLAGAPASQPPEVAAPEPRAEPHAVDQIAAPAARNVAVDESLVLRYLDYRRRVVARGRAAVEVYRKANPHQSPNGEATAAGSVRAARATEEFAARMRDIEEAVRAELALSRDEAAAVGQVVAEVLSARQLWRMSGGDEALTRARARLASVPAGRRGAAEQALQRNERGYAEMREARSARKRFGDAAVEAVLAHEDELWKVQQEGMRVMAEVY
ncbi:MAG TPA: hypothetical protein VE782_02140 [Myxococcaceae bacterium]|nr:hypothetical protein [Myxococcaceae bacterium]